MTDKPPPLPTSIALPVQPGASLASAVPVHDVAPEQDTPEEEPYTIKCICDYFEDDGNTIFCDTCVTWQHIECYYPDNIQEACADSFVHFCVQCHPRPLDHQRAIAHQRARMPLLLADPTADKKPKRLSSKSHKKKPKPSELQINGIHHGASESTKHMGPHDLSHPAKKAKTSHKSSQSISSQAPKRSPSHGNAKAAHGHPLSPATTPPDLPDDFELHNYSSGFLSSYNDQSFQIVNTNSFAGLQVSNTMTAWLHNPEKLQNETGLSYSDVFQTLPSDIESIAVRPEIEQNSKIISLGTVVQWQCLKAPSPIDKDVPLMEVNGQIGFQANYCADADNRWAELTAPLPFVLFHPLLPLYIDTRREGSEARFVRRSCKPNAVLETYLSAGSEYHFWLVSDRKIEAKEQITIPWDFRFPTQTKTRVLQLLGLADDTMDAHAEATEADYRKYANWLHLILSEHGGCACNLGPECAFARFHRNYLAKTQQRSNPPKSKKRKPRAQHAISPTSTGHAANSRAPSEGHLEDIPEHDRRSVSSSSRSKPPSRDMTPTARQGSFDTLGILTEPTDRDKRKVAMVEDTFRRMEQQQQHPQRKRKRASDGTGISQAKAFKSSTATQTPNISQTISGSGYVDAGAGASRVKSRSPSDPSPLKEPRSRTGSAPARSRRASVVLHPNYCDAAVQTDFPDHASETATPKRRTWHHIRLEEEERAKRRAVDRTMPAAMAVDSRSDGHALHSSPASIREADKDSSLGSPADESKDHPMSDARPASPMITSASGGIATNGLVKHKSPDLRVELPPVPAFENPTFAHSTASTPISAGVTVQSPFSATGFPGLFGPPSVGGAAVTPSPVKKKLSLSDYKNRLSKAAAARPPSVGTSLLKAVSSSADDLPKSATSTDGGTTTAGSSPVVEKAPPDPATPAEEAAAALAATATTATSPTKPIATQASPTQASVVPGS
ncbi:hypothetical protein N657DRAFT_654951 [Parathielavia appendiculata]|uniref:SET domain-containing protein n=1 Tax=Parathielavia appendiculata TaxID=2587402 RepID=A0AAN6U5H3_9PEZI|nr:hypothetical protein N657DRAFT_654951 [Parathielavia appendiculata]